MCIQTSVTDGQTRQKQFYKISIKLQSRYFAYCISFLSLEEEEEKEEEEEEKLYIWNMKT